MTIENQKPGANDGKRQSALPPVSLLGAGVFLDRDATERRWKALHHRETAMRLGITEDDLWVRKQQLAAAWEYGGGWEGARQRDEWLQNYLKRQAPNVGAEPPRKEKHE